MKTITKYITFLLISFSSLTNAQNSSLIVWKPVTKQSLEALPKMRRSSFPETAFYYQLDLVQLKAALQNAPERGKFKGQSPIVISFPNSTGVLEKFRVWDSPIMHPDLAAKYPMIKTYCAQGIDDPTATMRFSISQLGLNTFTLSGKASTNYIDPFTSDLNYYIVYDKESLKGVPQSFECFTDDEPNLISLRNGVAGIQTNTNDQLLRTFRLAQSCNAEYGNKFALTPGTEKADIMAQMTLTINRVNGVYERDLAITLQFIPNNDTLIFFGNTANDPWTTEFNTKTAQTIDLLVGVTNYDIGHNFNTSGGGNAGCIGCVCLSTSQTGTHKGRGETGSANPTGDAFDIDYVAHEMGHQFGGYHTMNTCSRSGNGFSEVEPASGTSIMGYAGICSSNTQAHSNDDFNYVNIDNISANVQPGGNSTCSVNVPLVNQPPVANAGIDFVVPKGTAFVLEGSATDPDGLASLTYNWSQNDPAQSPGNAAPLSTYAVGPLYDVIRPQVSPNRYMPNLASVVAKNLTPTWEVTPSVARTLNFSFIVRDNDVLGGQTSADLMKVTVDNAGPFIVTSQSTATNWTAGSSEIVTWNVAGTNSGAVNTANVNIYLSLDSGFTYPFVLAANVPNNGTANITVPASGATTTKGRIMVRGAGNIFFALNGNYISIVSSEFVMNFGTSVINTCPVDSAVYNFTYSTFLSFTDTTVFSASGNPAGTSVTFTPDTVINDGTQVQMVVNGLSAAAPGIYSITVTGTSNSVTKTTSVTLTIADPNPSATTLTNPINGLTALQSPLTFDWANVASTGVTYELQIATDLAFTTIITDTITANINSFTTSNLQNSTTYYWRVRAFTDCSVGTNSAVFSFTTGSCNTLASTNIPIAISNQGTPTIISTLSIPATGLISDVNVIGLIGTHSRINNLAFRLTSPSGTIVTLFAAICAFENDFDCSFDDAATPGPLPCPPIGGGTYQPQAPLSLFNNENPNGIWTLTVVDGATGGGGSLNGWGLEICTTTGGVGIATYTASSSISIFPNPTDGVFTITTKGLSNEFYDVKVSNGLGQILQTKNVSANTATQIDCSNYQSGIYFVTVAGNKSTEVRKIFITQ